MGPPAAAPSLDEITNRVFEELLQGKAEASKSSQASRTNPSDHGSVKVGRHKTSQEHLKELAY